MCTIAPCPLPGRNRNGTGPCWGHYCRIRKHGDPLAAVPIGDLRSSVSRRLPTKTLVAQRGYDTPCWEWTGSTDRDGYGRLSIKDRMVRVHRAAFEEYVRPLQPGEEPDHLCRNRPCWRPDHLEAVTQRENNARSSSPTAINARKTHCVHGHPLNGENLYVDPDGRRHCRACRRKK